MQEFNALQEDFNRLGGDVLTQLESDKSGLESEKNALLDYVTESLDNVASLESAVVKMIQWIIEG